MNSFNFSIDLKRNRTVLLMLTTLNKHETSYSQPLILQYKLHHEVLETAIQYFKKIYKCQDKLFYEGYNSGIKKIH